MPRPEPPDYPAHEPTAPALTGRLREQSGKLRLGEGEVVVQVGQDPLLTFRQLHLASPNPRNVDLTPISSSIDPPLASADLGPHTNVRKGLLPALTVRLPLLHPGHSNCNPFQSGGTLVAGAAAPASGKVGGVVPGSPLQRYLTEPLWWKARQLHLIASTVLSALRPTLPGHAAADAATVNLTETGGATRARVNPDETYRDPAPAIAAPPADRSVVIARVQSLTGQAPGPTRPAAALRIAGGTDAKRPRTGGGTLTPPGPDRRSCGAAGAVSAGGSSPRADDQDAALGGPRVVER